MLVFIAGLGLVAGAVINALADNLPYRRPGLRLTCRTCGAPWKPFAWSALVGAVASRNACAYCGTWRGWRPLLVEAASLAGFLWLYLRDPGALAFAAAALIASVFLLIVVIDIEHRLILHVVSVPTAVAVALLGVLDPNRGLTKTLLGGLAGFGFFLVLYLMGGVFARWIRRLRGQELDEVAFGFGDVMLAGVIGLAVGWPGVVVALFLGILAGGTFSLLFILAMLAVGRYRPFIPIPYGPFMVLGALTVYFGGPGLFVRLLSG
jgi:leader peptidase (prepilin peptidase)/N-methyltransferase